MQGIRERERERRAGPQHSDVKWELKGQDGKIDAASQRPMANFCPSFIFQREHCGPDTSFTHFCFFFLVIIQHYTVL